jgi:hypothetical protein
MIDIWWLQIFSCLPFHKKLQNYIYFLVFSNVDDIEGENQRRWHWRWETMLIVENCISLGFSYVTPTWTASSAYEVSR